MASLTPDPGKRGYLLPPGCKDLIDVLQRRKKPRVLALHRLVWTHGEAVVGQLSELERHVTMAWESDAQICSLALDSPAEGFAVQLQRGKGVAANASLHVQMGTDREKAMREFVVRHGFPLPVDKGMPARFRPELPVYQIYRFDPLPAEAPLAARILKALFQEVAGLDDDSELCFRHDETTITA